MFSITTFWEEIITLRLEGIYLSFQDNLQVFAPSFLPDVNFPSTYYQKTLRESFLPARQLLNEWLKMTSMPLILVTKGAINERSA